MKAKKRQEEVKDSDRCTKKRKRREDTKLKGNLVEECVCTLTYKNFLSVCHQWNIFFSPNMFILYEIVMAHMGHGTNQLKTNHFKMQYYHAHAVFLKGKIIEWFFTVLHPYYAHRTGTEQGC
jgi:hypothetical protein